MDDFENAYRIALSYIDYAPRTGEEVRRRLARSRFDAESIQAVITALERIGLVNDEQFSRDWVESRNRARGYGRTRLIAELRRKGIEPEQAEEAVETLDAEHEFETAMAVAQKRPEALQPGDPAARRRLTAYLQRRGYNWEIIEQVFARIFANNH